MRLSILCHPNRRLKRNVRKSERRKERVEIQKEVQNIGNDALSELSEFEGKGGETDWYGELLVSQDREREERETEMYLRDLETDDERFRACVHPYEGWKDYDDMELGLYE